MPGPIISVGTALLDRIYRVETFPDAPGVARTLEHVESGGGTAANAAAAIARLGGHVELWSRVGDDEVGKRIRAGLKSFGVDVRYVETFEEARSSHNAIIVDGRGQQFTLANRDSNMPSGTSWLPLERVDDAVIVMADLRWLEAVRSVFARARAAHVMTLLYADIAVRESLQELLSLTDFAVFSESALEDILPNQTRREQLDRVLLMGPRHAGVAVGASGYQWRDTFGGGQVLGPENVTITDVNGAGDAFQGTFALMLSEQRAVNEGARIAGGVAAMCCMRLGARAGLPTRAELSRFLGEGV